MKLLSFLFICSIAIVACKKKEAAPAAEPAPTGSAVAAAPSPSTGSAIATEGSATPDAAAAAAAPEGSATGSSAGSDSASGPRADCVLYAKVAKACGHGLRDEATIAGECEKALSKNTVMAGSINIQIACAKADPACDAFNKCVAKH